MSSMAPVRHPDPMLFSGKIRPGLYGKCFLEGCALEETPGQDTPAVTAQHTQDSSSSKPSFSWLEAPGGSGLQPSSHPASEQRAPGVTWAKNKPQRLEVDRSPCYSVRVIVGENVVCLSTFFFAPFWLQLWFLSHKSVSFIFWRTGVRLGNSLSRAGIKKKECFL